MDYWVIIPLILFTLGFIGTNLELKRLEKEISKLEKEIIKQKKKKRKKPL